MTLSEKASRQEKDAPHEGQQRVHDDGDHPKRNRKQPEKRPGDEKKERERPAKGQQDGP